jgi:diguanylate cyclase (GGDEF)-like protein
MFVSFLRPNNLSKKLMRVIFSIYLVVTCIVTGVQFFAEYIKTQNSILNELQQLKKTVHSPIATSLWQYNEAQLGALVDGVVKMPIIEGVDILDKDAMSIVSKRSYAPSSSPLSIFSTTEDLYWTLNGKKIFLGSLTLYSSSEVVFDRVLFGFSLVALAAVIKLSVLFWLFVWALDRYLAMPLKELMSQVGEVQLSKDISKRINLSGIEDNELNQLQLHMNEMLSVMESDREKLLEDEKTKRDWLENAVAERTKDLQTLNKKLKDFAAKDSLTGVLNRGSFFEAAQHLLVLSQRRKATASFVLMDLDYFKLINDTHGHFAGDQVLVHFTKTIQMFLRKSDLIGRVGGEEFALFLSDASVDDAFRIADKIRETIAESAVDIDGKTIHYTVSLGIDSSGAGDESIDELFKRADLKLYGAKDKGRDRVEK